MAAILAVIGVAVFFTAREALFNQVNNDLEGRAQPLFQDLRDRANRGLGPPGLTVARAFTAAGYSYAVVNADGQILAESPNLDPDALASNDKVLQTIEGGARFVDTKSSEGEDLRMYMVPIQGPAGNTNFVMQVGRSTEPERSALRALMLVLGAGGAFGVGLAVVGGTFLSGRALRPIQTAMDRQRAFVADASHELRTPLSLIRANAELMKRKPEADVQANMPSVDDIITETDRLAYLVGQMLTLARSDSGPASMAIDLLDLSPLAEDAARQMRLLAQPKGIALQAHANGAAWVRGEHNRLGELLLILLDNAVKYSDAGASIDVSVAQADGRVRLTVADTGRGIPAEALPHVFDRFYRVDKARSRDMGGTGLGLAIARWIAEAHGGAIALQSAEGRGTTVTVTLPAATLSS